MESAKTFDQQEEQADACVRNLGIKFTTVVDNFDNKVELTYAGWPDRLYLVGQRQPHRVERRCPDQKDSTCRTLEAAIQAEVETDRNTALRVLQLVEAVLRDPFTGIGKPEAGAAAYRIEAPGRRSSSRRILSWKRAPR